MEFIQTKTILQKVKHSSLWFGIDYNMNLYKGCMHGCIYCDSRSNCYCIDHFDTVRGKKDALIILEKELRSKRKKGVVGIGAMSDTYNYLEKTYQQTRQALQLLLQYNFGLSIDTKSDLILRDLDLLKKINEQNNVIIKFTITTPHDKLSSIIEPNVCVSSKRFQAIKQLSDQGIFVGILMTPLLPFICDKEEDIKLLVKKAYEHGAKFIYTHMGVTLRENQRDYYYQKLDQHFFNLTSRYKQVYGNRYMCYCEDSKRKYQVFTNECDKYGILYNMDDIIKAYKDQKQTYQQISLFDL